ncbi:MAG: hypothetical protein K1X89_05710 [Myxococcaceae bacterium]|nr:hypothetical protein [Myxococcaceae bacterium]
MSVRVVAVLAALLSAPAFAGIEVPVDVSAGPMGTWFFGPPQQVRGAVPHFGLLFDVKAIVDHQLIEKNIDRVPAQYRGMAQGIKELRISPSIFIPRYLYISPKLDAFGGVGMYGITWRPFGLTLFSTGGGSAHGWGQRPPPRVALEAGVLLTYIFVHSDRVEAPQTHFLRPGVDLEFSVEIFTGERFLVSLGGGGQAYVPQKMGEFGFGPFDTMMCLAAFAYLKLHYRFPYDVNL